MCLLSLAFKVDRGNTPGNMAETHHLRYFAPSGRLEVVKMVITD